MFFFRAKKRITGWCFSIQIQASPEKSSVRYFFFFFFFFFFYKTLCIVHGYTNSFKLINSIPKKRKINAGS